MIFLPISTPLAVSFGRTNGKEQVIYIVASTLQPWSWGMPDIELRIGSVMDAGGTGQFGSPPADLKISPIYTRAPA